MLTKSIWAELAPKWPSSWVFHIDLNNIFLGTKSFNWIWWTIKLY
jgi:hypothetical protein